MAITKQINDEIFSGVLHKKSLNNEKIWSTQTNLRCLAIKYAASNFELCRWMSKQSTLFAGFDGCTGDDRHFMEFHLIAVFRKFNQNGQTGKSKGKSVSR